MKSTVGIYDAHEDALEAIKELKRSGYSEKQLSIIGKAELVEDHLNVKSKKILKLLKFIIQISSTKGTGIAGSLIINILNFLRLMDSEHQVSILDPG